MKPSGSILTHCVALLLIATSCTQAHSEESVVQKIESKTVDVHVATAVAEKRPTVIVLDGTLIPDEESNVTSVVAGRVTDVFVERGSKVKANAPLVRLRDVDYRISAQIAQAQLQQARARLGMNEKDPPPKADALPEVTMARSEMDLAASMLARAEELSRSGAMSQQDLDSARSRAASASDRYQSARHQARASLSSLDLAKAQLNQASTSVREATVRAPFAGEIANRMVSSGEYVGPQSPLVTLVRTDPLRLELSIPQQHLSAVQVGETVTLTFDSIPGERFEAKVHYISAAVKRDTRSLVVEAIVPNPDGRLRPGLFATARLHTGDEQAVVVIPSSAVRTEAGVSRVFVVNEGKIQERVISIAEHGNDTTVVSDGLSQGDEVAVDTLDDLADGIAVRVLQNGQEG